MSDSDLSRIFGGLAEKIVFADPEAHEDLQGILAGLDPVCTWATGSGVERIEKAAFSVRSLVKSALEGVTEPGVALKAAGETVEALESFAVYGKNPDELLFPQILGIEENILDATTAANFATTHESMLERVDADLFEFQLNRFPGARDQLRRLIHTLKGEAGMLGLFDIQKVCHALEDGMVDAEPQKVVSSVDYVRTWLEQTFDYYLGRGEAPNPPGKVMDELVLIFSAPAKVSEAERFETPPPVVPPPDLDELECCACGAKENILTIIDELASVILNLENEPAFDGVVRIIREVLMVAWQNAKDHNCDLIADILYEAVSLMFSIEGVTGETTPAMRDVLLDVIDTIRNLALTGVADRQAIESLLYRIEEVKASPFSSVKSEYDSLAAVHEGKRLGDILLEEGTVTDKDISEALVRMKEAPGQDKLGSMLFKEGRVSAKKVAQVLRLQDASKEKLERQVKVDAVRLDELVDSVGELVITLGQLSYLEEFKSSPSAELMRLLGRLGRISKNMQNLSMTLRMVKLQGTFLKMAHLVRELAKKQGKFVEVRIEGGNVELDRSIVESISEALLHLVRNAVDHGIEATVEERRSAGKSDNGNILLNAYQSAGNVCIEITDDGAGLPYQKLLAKAREMLHVRDDETVDERDVVNLIWLPGLSTADKVTDVSGRGIGMDAVKRCINEVRGRAEVFSSPGKGTTFRLDLPLTLAIIDGLLFRAGEGRFVIPANYVKRLVKPESQSLHRILETLEIIDDKEGIIPLRRLSTLLGVSGADCPNPIVVLVEFSGRRLGLLVDEIVGHSQVVIKPLGEGLGDMEGVAGGSVLPDGSVGLILDIPAIVNKLSQRHH